LSNSGLAGNAVVDSTGGKIVRLVKMFFRTLRQMRVQKLIFVIILAVVLFGAYAYLFRNSESFAVEVPGPAGILEQPLPHLPERVIAQAGPQAPAQAADPHEAPVRVPPPTPNDPYAQSYQDSDFGDDNRAPQKLFGPAPLPTADGRCRRKWCRKQNLDGYQPSLEQFNPETAQDGGQFMDGGIFAYDKDVPTHYSEF
jgi:hypothetical protein